MAIAAYDRSSTTELEKIRQESPIHDKCGGRFVLPMLFAPFISAAVGNLLSVTSIIPSLVILECIFWVDKLKGLDKTPICSEASYFLQRFITTKKPGNEEILTAQKAIRELIAAHSSSVN